MIYSDDVLRRNSQLLNVLFKLRPILQKMNRFGIPLSREVLEFKSNDFRKQISEHWTKCFDIIGQSFNPDSSDQVKKIFYEVLGLPEVKIRNGRDYTVTTNKYALGKLHYEVKEAIKGNLDLKYNHKYDLRDIDQFLYEHRRAKKLRQALSFFIDSLLDLHVCKYESNGETCKGGFLDKAKTVVCPQCAKSGFYGVKGYDPHFVKERDRVWYAHPTILPLQTSGRISTLDKNWSQQKRNDKTWNISVRSVVKALNGYKLIMTDLSKAERLTASILFNSKTMFEEVERGAAAVSEFAVDAFDVPYEETQKGTEFYHTGKVALYASQFFCQGKTLHQQLLQEDIYFPVERCDEILALIEKKYHDYYENVKETTWKRLNGIGVVRTYQGRLFRMSMPLELSHIRNWRDIERYKQPAGVRDAWAKCCRMLASLVIQGSATGDHALLSLLKVTDSVDRFMNPKWDEIRLWNGKWDLVRPVMTKHDEIIIHCEDNYVDDIKKIQETQITSFETLEPYLENNSSPVKLNMKSETDICQYWDVPLDKTEEFERSLKSD